VTIVNNLWLAALTHDEDNASSNDLFDLMIEVDGTDVFNQDFVLGWGAPNRGTRDLGNGQAGFQESQSLSTLFESNTLTNSSIREGIRGEDAWGPGQVLVIGQTRSNARMGPRVVGH
jgi:hypothetical protein